MKKVKPTLALLLSLSMLAPIAACKDGEEDGLSNSTPPILSEDGAYDSSEEESSSQTPETSEDEENESDSEINSDSNSNSSSPPQSSPPNSSSPPNDSSSSSPSNPPSESPSVSSTAKYIKLTGNNVNLRSGAGTGYSVLGQAEESTVYAVIGQTGNWYKTYHRNKTAYVYASYTTAFTIKKTTAESVENVIEEGYKLIGVPYVYGAVRFHDGNGKLLAGFTSQKFDCSSLIQYIFYQGAGKLLDVNTRTQVKQGKYVKPSDLKRGDCIFFTNEQRQYNTGIERIGHVALYLGNDYILHTSSDYARIEKLTAKRWSFYVEARRFL